MALRQTGQYSTTYWVVTVVVILGSGLWASWFAWTTAAPFEPRLRPAGLPQEYLLLTCSLLALYGAAQLGGWLVGRTRDVAREARRPSTIMTGAVTIYGLIASAVFAVSTASEWSLAAVLPLGLMAYLHVLMVRSARGEAPPTRGDTAMPAGDRTSTSAHLIGTDPTRPGGL